MIHWRQAKDVMSIHGTALLPLALESYASMWAIGEYELRSNPKENAWHATRCLVVRPAVYGSLLEAVSLPVLV